jgi:hypothetical protein
LKQPELEIALMGTAEMMMFNKEAAGQMRELVKRGTFDFFILSGTIFWLLMKN